MKLGKNWTKPRGRRSGGRDEPTADGRAVVRTRRRVTYRNGHLALYASDRVGTTGIIAVLMALKGHGCSVEIA